MQMRSSSNGFPIRCLEPCARIHSRPCSSLAQSMAIVLGQFGSEINVGNSKRKIECAELMSVCISLAPIQFDAELLLTIMAK